MNEVLAHLEATAAEDENPAAPREFPPRPLIAYHDISTSESVDSVDISHSSGSEDMASAMAKAAWKKEKEEGVATEAAPRSPESARSTPSSSVTPQGSRIGVPNKKHAVIANLGWDLGERALIEKGKEACRRWCGPTRHTCLAAPQFDEVEDLTYVSMKQLDLVKAHLKKADEVTIGMILPLMYPEHTVKDEMMVPIDMRVAEQDFDGPAQMLMKIGPRGCAEAYGATC